MPIEVLPGGKHKKIWIAHGGNMVRAAPEHVRLCSGTEALAEVVARELRSVGATLQDARQYHRVSRLGRSGGNAPG